MNVLTKGGKKSCGHLLIAISAQAAYQDHVRLCGVDGCEPMERRPFAEMLSGHIRRDPPTDILVAWFGRGWGEIKH